MSNNLFANLTRNIAFAQRIPPQKLLRRLHLAALRKTSPLPPWPQDAPPLSADPPRPLFPLRLSTARKLGENWHFTFLNRSVDCGPGPDWRAPHEGPSRQLWRMNLHYMEYLEALDDTHTAQLIDSWLSASPTPEAWRDAWTPYAASIRAVVLMQQLAVRQSLDNELRTRVIKSIAAHIAFIERFLENDIGGNHLIKNIKALLWASRFFSGSRAEHWRARGVALLGHELAKQILPDGAHYERSPSYHAQVFADLLEIRAALGAGPLHGALDAALAHMAQACADLTHPDGGPALFNDAGLAMAYAPAECIAAYTRLFNATPTPRAVFALPDAGYFGMRSDQLSLIADCGAITPDDLPAHGHGDMLSFELNFQGKRFIVNQGVFEYEAGPRRDQSRSAAFHNTLCFDGADQADFFSAFRMGRRGKPRVRQWAPRNHGFVLEGEHDGFAYLPGAPRHIRRFEAEPTSLLIEDCIAGKPKLGASAMLLLHPEVTVSIHEHGATLSRDDAALDIQTSLPLTVEPAAWWPDMGVELPTTRLRVRLDPPAHTLTWRFAPHG